MALHCCPHPRPLMLRGMMPCPAVDDPVVGLACGRPRPVVPMPAHPCMGLHCCLSVRCLGVAGIEHVREGSRHVVQPFL